MFHFSLQAKVKRLDLSSHGYLALMGISFSLFGFLLYWFIPRPPKIETLTANINLITQVLSIVTGISLVGATLHLSSYNAAEKLTSLLKRIEKIGASLTENHYNGPPVRSRLRRSGFRKRLLSSAELGTLEFAPYRYEEGKSEGYFILRPYWDGAWYQVHKSPQYSNESSSREHLRLVQYIHELIICGIKVLEMTHKIRNSGATLISTEHGTQGSIWFLEDFAQFLENHNTIHSGSPPEALTIEEAHKIVSLAVNSTHYMWEELRCLLEEKDFKPFSLSQFQVIFLDYLLWLTYFTQKFQLLRIENIRVRKPSIESSLRRDNFKPFDLERLHHLQSQIMDLRKDAVAQFGVNRKFSELLRQSIPGIGLAAIALILTVLFWPFSDYLTNKEIVVVMFVVLYALGVMAILSSLTFMFRMLWGITPQSVNATE